MIDCNGNPVKDSVAQFLSLSTGKSYEAAYMDLTTPKVEPYSAEKSNHSFLPKGMIEVSKPFDYRDLVGKYGNLPSRGQVADFMVNETGLTHESAIIKLDMPKFSNDVKIVGGVTMYPVSMINAI